MVGKTKALLLKPARSQDAGGEIVGEPVSWRHVWGTKTENGGRSNLYASRIVHENSAVLSIPFIAGVTSDMLIEIAGRRRPIEGVYEEGFRKKLHILFTISDLDYNAGH